MNTLDVIDDSKRASVVFVSRESFVGFLYDRRFLCLAP